MKNKNVDVFKFGGSSLADSDCLLHVCDLIHQNTTENLIVVVSAMSGVTNQLLAISKDKNDENCNAISNHFKKTIEEISIDSNNKKELLSAFSKDIETIEKIIDAGQFEANNPAVVPANNLTNPKITITVNEPITAGNNIVKSYKFEFPPNI